ncbi:MAG: type II toxin-antitoxin system death-on-curing family toxin [Caldilineaceae bacterium]
MEILFLRKQDIVDMHARTLAQHGGSPGLRDEGGLESALAAPENRYYYEGADLYECAATYAFHLTQAHAFVDGNKRIAAAATLVFLELNGINVNLPEQEVIDLFLGIAASQITRAEVEQYLKKKFEI